mmetsp:Transcript_81293/g.128163  ORF Transcript_81293/g.128163 Transcript_81293/m.128163 type:complete len:324 (+) Transcript_81293:32-1003(+)
MLNLLMRLSALAFTWLAQASHGCRTPGIATAPHRSLPNRDSEVSRELSEVDERLAADDSLASLALFFLMAAHPAAGLRYRARFQSPVFQTAGHRSRSLRMNDPEVVDRKSKKGFVDQMRAVAMRLHTPQQSKKGKKEATEEQERPVSQWKPTLEGYLRFLVESKAVYDRMESIVAEAPDDTAYHAFKNTGLERGAKLKEDIDWLAKEYNLEVPAATGDGSEYADHLEQLAKTDTPAFICHFYNVYFAHSAGGRMIGRKVSEAVLEGKELNFYQWDDLQGSLSNTKEKLNAEADKWTKDQKEHCLNETAESFKKSGALLRYVTS